VELMPVRDSWARIEAWLAEHARFVLDSLNPGASPADIKVAAAALGVEGLPDDFVRSWLIHDGQDWRTCPPLVAGWLGSYSLLPLKKVVGRWETLTGLLSSGTFDEVRGKPRGPVRADWWNQRWVPIAANASGDLVCLDLDPPPGGAAGQVIEYLHDDRDRTVLAASLGAWLGEFATDLEVGRYNVYDETHGRYFGLVHVRDL